MPLFDPAPGFNALTPMTTAGDIEIEASAGTAGRLAIGSTGQILSVVSGLPAWQSLDQTTGDIAASPGTAAHGAIGLAADAGHVHPQPAMFAPAGLTGATAASRYAGATASGAPASGTFAVGDYVITQAGNIWICTVAGSPGTWVKVAQLDSTAGDIKAPAAAAVAGSSGLAADASHVHPLQDPLQLGIAATALPYPNASNTIATNNNGYYLRLISGGYSISAVAFYVANTGGNMSAAAYTRSGTGASASPTGGQLQTSGAVATPANGFASATLGGSVTPNIGDFLAISSDTAATAFLGPNVVASGTMLAGFSYSQATAHPLPGTPSSLSGSGSRSFILRGQ